jgi:hypothetical protein
MLSTGRPKRTKKAVTHLNSTTRLGQHVCRYGWHFPKIAVLNAMNDLGLTDQHLIWESRNHLAFDQSVESQLLNDANYQELMLELFPRIPEEDLTIIKGHAFAKGAQGIGGAEHMQYAQRFQIAVLAHIRHIHTDYDQLFVRGYRKMEARAKIETKCLRILLKWRGEDDEVELVEQRETEVIVIDSDEDEGSSWDVDDDLSNLKVDDDIEIISWKKIKRPSFSGKPSTPEFPQRKAKKKHRARKSIDSPKKEIMAVPQHQRPHPVSQADISFLTPQLGLPVAPALVPFQPLIANMSSEQLTEMVMGLASMLTQTNNFTPVLPPPAPLPFPGELSVIPSIERVATISPTRHVTSYAPKRKDLETEGPNEGVTIVYDNDGVAFYLVPSGTWPVEQYKWIQVPRESRPVVNTQYQETVADNRWGAGPSGSSIRYI